MNEFEKLMKALQDARADIKSVVDSQTEEIKKHGETSTATAKKLTEVEAKYEKLCQDFAELEAKMGRLPQGGVQKQIKSIGGQFIEGQQYKAMKESGKYESSPLHVGSFHKTLISSDAASAGDLIVAQRISEIVSPAQRQLTVRDLLNQGTTTSNAIEYVEETLFTNNAAMVPEGPAGGKPESAMVFDAKSVSVKTLAHWIPATRQVIDDVSQLQSYIDGRLIYGLKLVEEAQLLYGDGTGNNLRGLMTAAQVYNRSVGGDSRIDTLRRAITQARLANYPVDGMIVNSEDWEAIELQKGSDGHYIWVSVTEGGASRLWRVPVVETPAMTENDFLVGAFKLGAQIWDREDANVRISEHHADYFTKNLIAILAEERLALAVYRPQAFVKGNYPAA